MGEEVQEQGRAEEIVAISSDQMYAPQGDPDEKTLKSVEKQHEAAAITMAKKAASQFLTQHPDSLNEKIDVT